MTREINPWIISIVVLIVWMVIVFGGEIMQAGGTTSFQRLLSHHVVYSFVVGPIFLLAVVAHTRWWREVGLQPDGSTSSLKLLVMPALAVIFIWAIAFSRGLPWSTSLILIGANTLLVGFSEELMFRGIFFYGSQSSFGWRWAVVITAVIFGLSHAMNGLITGDPTQAIGQAFLTTLFGFWIVALRLYLSTIIPLIVIHWLWDFGIFGILAASADTASASISNMLPVAVEIALFAYGLGLLRAYANQNRDLIRLHPVR